MRALLPTLALLAAPLAAGAQMDHSAHASQGAPGLPTHAGQEAFATVAEIVGILKNDPNTDWAKVDLEALRQHLIDMDEVTMRATAKAMPVDGGVQIDISGDGRTRLAITRVVTAHAPMLSALPAYSAKAEPVANGVRLTVLSRNPTDSAMVTRIRALGFIGLMTEGAHHQAHHLAIARGEGEAAHQH
ncbi:MAG: hypothetical protein U0163_06055 [Gemmatimonadaceae bacterium]